LEAPHKVHTLDDSGVSGELGLPLPLPAKGEAGESLPIPQVLPPKGEVGANGETKGGETGAKPSEEEHLPQLTALL